MIITVILVIFALLALLGLVAVARGRSEQITDVAALEGKLRPVDVVAFSNLVDSDEEEFLRKNLPAAIFRTVHRERIRAAVEYVECVAQNASVLLRLGEAARTSVDPEIASAGRELLELALRIRIYCLAAGIKLRARMVLPGLRVSPNAVSNSYENLTVIVGRLGRLQHRSRVLAAAS
jgi:methylaspartate ammonia-lyase